MTAEPRFALSVKQPWAALIVAGRKTIEVRTWPTQKIGPILIHAARIPDERPRGWSFVDNPELKALAEFGGGILGVAELIRCVRYRTAEEFTADEAKHLNAPDWFRASGLCGFEFEHARIVPFRKFTGNTFFFPVAGDRIDAPEFGSKMKANESPPNDPDTESPQ